MRFKAMFYVKEKGHPVLRICELLRGSRSGFYSFLKTRGKLEKDKNLEKNIESIFKKNKGCYGSPRVYRELKRCGVSAGENKVARIMKLKNLSARQKKPYVPRTTKNNPLMIKSPRLFKTGQSQAGKENQVWCSDLTYIPFRDKFLYLVVFLDVYNREIKSWKLCESLDGVHSKQALRAAVQSVSGNLEGLIIHSDQGVQYCCEGFRKELKFFGLKQSMSRKGNCYDNAFVESFFHTLKDELEYKDCTTKEELEKKIAIYMDWYNKVRMHSSLKYMSPKEFKQRRALRT